MERSEALKAVRSKVQNENLVKHMLATEAIMKALARKFNENEEEWGLSGLLHDIDIEVCKGDMTNHSKLGSDIVKEMGVSEKIAHAILTHNGAHGVPRASTLDKALYSADPLTGLITATALLRPDKLKTLEASSVLKRFKSKNFAAGANREQMSACSEIGLTLEEFVDIGIKAMQSVAPELGL